MNTVEGVDLSFILDEIKKAIALLKRRKFAGVDGPQAELLKYSGNRLHEEFFPYITACLNSEIISSQRKDSNIIAIYKGKDDMTE